MCCTHNAVGPQYMYLEAEKCIRPALVSSGSWTDRDLMINNHAIRFPRCSVKCLELKLPSSSSLDTLQPQYFLAMNEHLHDELSQSHGRVKVSTAFGEAVGGRAKNGSVIFLGMRQLGVRSSTFSIYWGFVLSRGTIRFTSPSLRRPTAIAERLSVRK